ncbi:ABC transporter ATP-binding protein [Desertibacillus haloalkaliphilus]|uniref:ABC transporter ATP-binding protein n=1 Tax=Desertibacillus haloalkaliphilus TaxID=1328930 RepID=UPI001C274F65|nr:ATP-binding cassette domain-containing protein [Desertibacillus haloalkaliphilus]MBU8906356.1 ATP-binding cassette domain-containing protein [Desertibacillus haloalkaliphilus]
MLEVKGVSYRYRKREWLMRNVDVTVQPGEIIGLSGPSGTGKTTFAKIIAGYLSPLEGRVTVDGHTRRFEDEVHPVQLVWQHPEKAVNPRWRLESTLKEGVDYDEELLQLLEIKREWLNRWPNELSGGELQRICIARALGPTTRYLIADEMTTMLDAITQAQIWHAILYLAKQRNIGVISISHNKHLLNTVSDRIVHFREIANR